MWYPSRMRHLRIVLFAAVVLASTLACRAATRLILGETPAPPALTVTTTAAAAPPTPTLQTADSCPAETASILDAANNAANQNSSFPQVDTGDQADLPMVIYTVNANDIVNPILEKVPRNLIKYQNDFKLQKQAWDLFANIIPQDQRTMIRQYEIITDGPGNVLGAVEQTPYDPNAWILEVDIADAPDAKNLAFTMLHEFGHLLTLNPSQVPPDLRVFRNPQDEAILNEEVQACPTYFPGEGCSAKDSYINVFFNRFWTGIYNEWQKIDNIQNDQKRENRLEAFYNKYQDQFIDDYAVTDPSEDIAETWAYYILSPRPKSNSIADQKIKFFYEYPELVQLRRQILQNLCAANP